MSPLSRAYASLVEDNGTAVILQVAEAISLCNSVLTDLVLRIEGEVSSFSVSRGKFVFFELKDEQEEARVSCFMMLYQLGTPLEDGMRVVIQGRAGLYQKSGQFRITVQSVAPQGEGSVKRAFELLKQKLEKEGLFALERKRPLPRFVSQIGIISSAEAAGFGDFKKIALQRLPGMKAWMANVAVQGNDAEKQICQAFDFLNSRYDLDVIVLLRGGGSLEDLHAFNSEAVARAIVRSKAPVLVGVGHERDVTIADFCADVRAATPSSAAQLLLPTLEEVENEVIALTQSGRRKVERAIQSQKERVTFRVGRLGERLRSSITQRRTYVTALIKTIEAVSPQATLKRGYSLTCNEAGQTITDASTVKTGERLTTRFAQGELTSQVIE